MVPIMKMYTIRDSVTQLFFSRVFLFENDAHAIRVFKGTVTNQNDPMSENPDDYTLYYVGTYDDAEGIPLGQDPRRVITGTEAVRQRTVDLEKLEALNAEIAQLTGANGGGQIQPGGTD